VRREGLVYPKYRHGVCLCREHFGGPMHFGWLEHVKDSWYACPECLDKARELPDIKPIEYQLKSVSLMAPYLDSDLIPANDVRVDVEAFLTNFRVTGALPSRPDDNRNLGYDYGLLLFAAYKHSLPADDLLEKMLSIRDDAGGWGEYYIDNVPSSTRCRPWESSVNIESALCYLGASRP